MCYVLFLLAVGGGSQLSAAMPAESSGGYEEPSGEKVAAGKRGWADPFDDSKVAVTYARYRTRYPYYFYAHIKKLVNEVAGLEPGKKVNILELGTGTGGVALGIMEHLGSKVAVTAVDMSEAMLRVARAEGLKRGIKVHFQCSKAVSTPYSDASFDIVITTRSWQFFGQKEVMREVKRLLKPGGLFMMASYATCDGAVIPVTGALLREYNPRWALTKELGAPTDYVKMFCKNSFTAIRAATYVDRSSVSQDY